MAVWSSDAKNTVCLLHFDAPSTEINAEGDVSSAILTDSSLYGTECLSMTQENYSAVDYLPRRTSDSTTNKKFGSNSFQFWGGQYSYVRLSGSHLALGREDFTIECWIKPTSLDSTENYYITTQHTLSDWGISPSGVDNTANLMLRIYPGNSGARGWGWMYHGGGEGTYTSWQTLMVASSSPSMNNWYHIALCREQSRFHFYVNGVEEGSGVTRDMQINSSQWKLGSYGSNGFNGYMDEFRILRGEAAFTGNFTPPTAPYELF